MSGEEPVAPVGEPVGGGDRGGASRVEAVVFDLYDTLVHVSPTLRAAHSAALGARLGLSPDAFARAWAQTGDASNRGLLRTEERVAETARLAGVVVPTASVLHELAASEHAFLADAVQLEPDVVGFLHALREAGIRTGLLSNCSPSGGFTLDASGLAPLLDHIVLSFETGHVKPEPEIFALSLAGVGAAPDATAYVADGQSGELEAALELGLRPVRVTWSTDTGTSPAGVPVVRGLADVAALVLPGRDVHESGLRARSG